MIIKNAVRCKLCNDEPESKYTHDFRYCKCGNVAVDGGKEYLRRVFNTLDWEEISITKEDDNFQEQRKPPVPEQVQ